MIFEFHFFRNETINGHFLSSLYSYLQTYGIKEHQIKEVAEHGYKAWQSQEYIEPPHLDQSSWFLPNASRSDAENLLLGMPPGTFLIRARNAGGYALSITCNGTTNHCIIHETETGFGFSEPFNIYESLMALVKHYAKNSLEEHNDVLTTTLRWPVNCSYILNIKEQQRRAAIGSDGGGSGGRGGSGGDGGGGGGSVGGRDRTISGSNNSTSTPLSSTVSTTTSNSTATAAVISSLQSVPHNLGLGFPTYMSK